MRCVSLQSLTCEPLRLPRSALLSQIVAFSRDAEVLARCRVVASSWRKALSVPGRTGQLEKSLVRFGRSVSSSSRWVFWQHLLHQRRAARRRKETEKVYEDMLQQGMEQPRFAEARAVIAADVPRTLQSSDSPPSLRPESAVNPLPLEERAKVLSRILVALAAACPSVGYCQGLDMACGFILSVAEEAAIAAAGLDLERAVFAFLLAVLELGVREWFEPPLLGLRAATFAFWKLLQNDLPLVAQNLASECVGCELLVLPWFQTLFCGVRWMPRDVLSRIWEAWLLDGTPKVLFRTALMLFQQSADSLSQSCLEDISQQLKQCPPGLSCNPATFLELAWRTKVTSRVLSSLVAEANESLCENSCALQNLGVRRH